MGRVHPDRFCEGAWKATVAGFCVASPDSREMRIKQDEARFFLNLILYFPQRPPEGEAGWLHIT